MSNEIDVFVVHHERALPHGEITGKMIGIYRSTEKARGAIARVSVQPGFRDYPDDFRVEIQRQAGMRR